jgi:hypothetical protein
VGAAVTPDYDVTSVLISSIETTRAGEPAAPAQSEQWGAAEWLTYYGECRQFQAGLTTRFSDFAIQASIFASAVCTLMITLRDTLGDGSPLMIIAFVTCLPLMVCWRFLVTYFRQIRVAGGILAAIERRVGLPADVSLLVSCRQPGIAFYNSRIGSLMAFSYLPLLMAAILVTAFFLS